MSCDKIKKIEYIKSDNYKKKYVYDFSVKDNETFMLTNGLFVHNTLNTFHLAGVSSKSNVNQGVPRLRELISVSKNIKTPSMTIYLNNDISTESLALQCLTKVQKISFDYFVKETEIYFDPHIYQKTSIISEDKGFVEDYYKFFDLFYEDLETSLQQLSPWVLRIKIHSLYLLNKNMKMIELTTLIKQKLKLKFNKDKFNIIFSDENSKYITIHIRFVYDDIYKMVNNEKNYITENDQIKLKEMESFIMNDMIISGNTHIKDAFIGEVKEKYIKKIDGSIQQRSNFIINTEGSALSDLFMSCDFINKNKTFSNDLYEMLNYFGIEVARELLKNEITNIIKNNGIYINKRHIDLLINIMTHKGFLNSIDRHGMNKADAGPLTKMSFEEAELQLSTASISNQEDKMNSFTSNLIMGQEGNYGTGFCELIFDDEAFC